MKTVYFDVDTQLDFVNPAGALYAPGAERILPAVQALNRHAAHSKSPLISTMDAHREDDAEFRTWPGHCVAGTLGQRKPEGTLLRNRVIVPGIAAEVAVAGIDQILLEKQSLDCFTNPNLAALTEALGAERYVVYGVVTEFCVKYAAWGLLRTGQHVELVRDAVASLNEADGEAMLREFEQAGGAITTLSAVLA